MDNYYAFRCSDDNTLMNSSSGGAFYCLAQATIDNNGIVYGVIIADDGAIQYSRAESIEGVIPMMGSKYAASSMSDEIWDALMKDVSESKTILFIGTPCMVNGVRRYLNLRYPEYGKIMYCDFYRCHGGFSPLLWKEECNRIAKNGNVRSVKFRDKSKSWRCFDFSYIYNDCSKNMTDFNLSCAGTFLGLDEARRRCCENCTYVLKKNRMSDISIGDFWNSSYLPGRWNDDKGASIIVTHSDAGNTALDKIKCCGDIVKVSNEIEDEDAVISNRKFFDEKEKKRLEFWNLFYDEGYDAVVDRYCPHGFIQWFKFCVVRKLLVKTRIICIKDKINNRRRLQKNG